jgi:hypothetical protein
MIEMQNPINAAPIKANLKLIGMGVSCIKAESHSGQQKSM